MSQGVNFNIYIGNLCADPETAYTTDGLQVTKFRIAVNTKRGKRENTLFRNVVTFGKLAEVASEYLRKGSQVYVSGEANDSQWEDNNGNKRFSTELVADRMTMLGGPKNNNRENNNNRQPPAPNGNQAPVFDDDIPF